MRARGRLKRQHIQGFLLKISTQLKGLHGIRQDFEIGQKESNKSNFELRDDTININNFRGEIQDP